MVKIKNDPEVKDITTMNHKKNQEQVNSLGSRVSMVSKLIQKQVKQLESSGAMTKKSLDTISNCDDCIKHSGGCALISLPDIPHDVWIKIASCCQQLDIQKKIINGYNTADAIITYQDNIQAFMISNCNIIFYAACRRSCCHFGCDEDGGNCVCGLNECSLFDVKVCDEPAQKEFRI